MNAYHELGEILGILEAAEEQYNNLLNEAVREANQMTIEVLSEDESVKLRLRGDFTVDKVTIHRRKYEAHDANSLRAAVLSAYQRAVIQLKHEQQLRVLRTLSPES